ncbi:efflux RND transporter periplasmic adaptor subunit [Chitinophaga tropicalis]|nr:efflux RND transporter periplasmic adaptor subunit [Chitinophaga tropicalis]
MSVILRPASLIFLIAFCSSCGHKEEKQTSQVPVKVSISTIQRNDMPQIFSYSGTIEPDNTAQVGFAVSGIINGIYVQEGQLVKQGQLLATIDATEYSNALAIANAGLEQAEDLYARLNGLYEKGSLPAKDYIDIKTKLAQAKANKSINAKHIADSRLYAPITGIITEKKIEKGSTAAPGIPAFTIIKTDLVYARMSVPESEIGALQPGTVAKVFVPTLNDTITGKVSIINPQADAVSRTYIVKIKLDNSTNRLLPGMLTDISIVTGRQQAAIAIPATAVVRDADDLTYVFVANGENKAIRKRISTGRLTGASQVVITEGLNEGDKLITAGQTQLKDGSAISF